MGKPSGRMPRPGAWRSVAGLGLWPTGSDGDLEGRPLGTQAHLDHLHDVFGIAADRSEAARSRRC